MTKGVLNNDYAKERNIKSELVFRYKVRAQLLASAIKKYSDKKNKLDILDLGAAEGKTICYLDKIIPGNKITGIEYSRDLIDQSIELPENLNIIQADVNNMNEITNDNSYDVVSALALLEHLKDNSKCMKEVKRVLRPGGIFVATCPEPFWDKIATKAGLLREEQHETDMSKDKMLSLMEKTGLKIIKYQRFMWAPISLLPYFKINILPNTSLNIDNLIYSIRIFNWLFVNQIIIAKK